MSQAPHIPTDKDRATVEAMAAYGVPQDDIAKVVGISDVTLRQHYRHELDTAAAKANTKAVEILYKNVLNPDPRYQASRFFWLKCRAGLAGETIHRGFGTRRRAHPGGCAGGRVAGARGTAGRSAADHRAPVVRNGEWRP